MAQKALNYQAVDSTSYVYYLNGDWNKLIKLGKEAIHYNIDFPYLHMRIGYAAFAKNNFGLAAKEYNIALSDNQNNAAARYYKTYSEKYLNRTELANYQASFLSDSIKHVIKTGYAKLISGVDLESSFKHPVTKARLNGFYERIGIATRISKRFSIYQSISVFRQHVIIPELTTKAIPPNRPIPVSTGIPVRERQYYFKANIVLSQNTLLKLSYHHFHNVINVDTTKSNLIFAAIKYYIPKGDVQFEATTGKLIDTAFTQIAFTYTYYPFGNLNFYGSTRASVILYTSTLPNVTQTMGFKLSNHFWMEGNITIGKIHSYTENDGLFINNSVDDDYLKFGFSALFPCNAHTTLQFHYTLENKILYLHTNNIYNQHSITIGFSWKL